MTSWQINEGMVNVTEGEFVVKGDPCIQGEFPNICSFRLINVSTYSFKKEMFENWIYWYLSYLSLIFFYHVLFAFQLYLKTLWSCHWLSFFNFQGGILAMISLCGILLNITVMFVILGKQVPLSNQVTQRCIIS